MTNATIHPDVHVGHVHLRVSDLERSLAFYRDALGFGVFGDGRPHGIPAVFLAAGDYHHHIALNAFGGEGAAPSDPERAGLFHLALVYPDREELARAVRRVVANGYEIDHATDHGGSVSVYLADPDGNGVELYYDRPREAWFEADGAPVLRADRIPIASLL